MPEGLWCGDGVCSGYGVQDARLWCRIGTQPAPRPPLPMHGLGMGWFWVPLPGAGSAWPYCRAQGDCMGLGGPQIPPVRPPGCLLQGNSTQICLVQGVGIVWWLYGRADPRAPLKAPGFFFYTRLLTKGRVSVRIFLSKGSWWHTTDKLGFVSFTVGKGKIKGVKIMLEKGFLKMRKHLQAAVLCHLCGCQRRTSSVWV